jgi:hypothetical protein
MTMQMRRVISEPNDSRPMHIARVRSTIIILMLAVLAALAPASSEAAAFSPGDVLTSRYAYGIIGVDPTDGSRTLITGSDSYSFRGVVIAPNGDLLVINWLAPDPELVRINPTDGSETVVSPLRFCPDQPVTRGQLAVFLVRALDGPGAELTVATGTVFHDVAATDPFASFIERLWALRTTTGCGGGNYCPDRPLKRDEIAVLLLRALHGPGYVPPDATGTLFTDISVSHPYAAWIEQLAHEGITGGCAANPARYCPDAPVSREQAAALLVRAFHLLPD